MSHRQVTGRRKGPQKPWRDLMKALSYRDTNTHRID